VTRFQQKIVHRVWGASYTQISSEMVIPWLLSISHPFPSPSVLATSTGTLVVFAIPRQLQYHHLQLWTHKISIPTQFMKSVRCVRPSKKRRKKKGTRNQKSKNNISSEKPSSVKRIIGIISTQRGLTKCKGKLEESMSKVKHNSAEMNSGKEKSVERNMTCINYFLTYIP
jgi:hypothetical protein